MDGIKNPINVVRNDGSSQVVNMKLCVVKDLIIIKKLNFVKYLLSNAIETIMIVTRDLIQSIIKISNCTIILIVKNVIEQ